MFTTIDKMFKSIFISEVNELQILVSSDWYISIYTWNDLLTVLHLLIVHCKVTSFVFSIDCIPTTKGNDGPGCCSVSSGQLWISLLFYSENCSGESRPWDGQEIGNCKCLAFIFKVVVSLNLRKYLITRTSVTFFICRNLSWENMLGKKDADTVILLY